MPPKRSPHAAIHDHALDFWLARGAVLIIAGLQMLFVNNNLVYGPKWLNPALELAILLPLSVGTAWSCSAGPGQRPKPITGRSSRGIAGPYGSRPCCSRSSRCW